MKKILIIISAIAVVSFIIIYSMNLEVKNKTNGFERNFIKTNISLENTILTNRSHFGLVGDDDKGNPILFNYKYRELYKIEDRRLKQINFNKPEDFKIIGYRMRASSRFNKIFLNNDTGQIAVVKNNNTTFYPDLNVRYDISQVISNNAIIVRNTNVNKTGLSRSLKKIFFNGNSAKIVKEQILPGQVESYYSNDGRLYYDMQTNKLFYMFFYRGTILSLDTNLAIVHQLKTIDTVTNANIKIKFTNTSYNGKFAKRTENTSTNNIVNSAIAINENKIYVYSKLSSDGEKSSETIDNMVIDVYNLESNRYIYSFYIPKFKRQRISNFTISNGCLTAITPNHILIYSLSKDI